MTSTRLVGSFTVVKNINEKKKIAVVDWPLLHDNGHHAARHCPRISLFHRAKEGPGKHCFRRRRRRRSGERTGSRKRSVDRTRIYWKRCKLTLRTLVHTRYDQVYCASSEPISNVLGCVQFQRFERLEKRRRKRCVFLDGRFRTLTAAAGTGEMAGSRNRTETYST